MSENILPDPSVAFNTQAPRRVVSLVPSITGNLIDLGLGRVLVGVSDYCALPLESQSGVKRVGGPKTVRVDEVVSMQPDLVLANREENSQDAVERLAQAGFPVWLAFPTTVQMAIQDLWTIANLFRNQKAMQQVDLLERTLEWAATAASGNEPMRYFCPVWEDIIEIGERWWMTFNAQTYSNDVLAFFGGQNIFARRERRYPLLADLGYAKAEEAGDRDTRYPRVTFSEVLASQPEIIFLPSEPFAYQEEQCAAFQELFVETPAAQTGRIYTIDGSLIHWPGTRLARAVEELPRFFEV